MRPETIPELIGVIVLSIVAIGSAIAVKLQVVTHTTFFAILASSTGIGTMVFGIRHYLRSQPKILQIKREDWKVLKEPISTHKDVRVCIPAKDHGKGVFAKVEFLPDSLQTYNNLLYAENAPNGDIWIYHVPGSFMYPSVRTCRIKITAH